MKTRTLRPGERIPQGDPNRYPDPHGLVRLRWRVGNELVEVREHKVNEGVVTDHVIPRKRSFDVQRAKALYEAGRSTPEIARMLSIDNSAIFRALQAEGVVFRAPNSYRELPEELRRQIVEALRQGKRFRAIRRALGLGSEESVARIARELGIPSGPQGCPPGWKHPPRTHCGKGHELVPENRDVNGRCRQCKWVRRAERRAREVHAPGHATWEQVLARVAYFGDRCWMCHGPWTEIDHVIALIAGGTNWPANLRPACRSCNARKGRRSFREYRAKAAA